MSNQPTQPNVTVEPVKIALTTGPKKCKPFVIEVMVFAPASGFKIEVLIEKSCTPQADAVWKIVFDLYKRKESGNGFDQLVHVSFKGGTPVEQKGIQATAANGLNDKQADVIVNEAGPAVLELKDAGTMTQPELEVVKKEVVSASTKIANFALES
ncbi:MAG TPA: hypothetical protein VJU86_17685 [Pyrinomonadaceae bacterium]|nr:hypothetical protein [Pyrinomonadaceae bacterium]